VKAPRSDTRGAVKRIEWGAGSDVRCPTSDVRRLTSNIRHPTSNHERGQALTEYALLCGLLFATLFVPFFPAPQGGLVSVFELSIQAFDIYIRSFHSVLMLPIP
jgi:hypothetical protein